MCVHSLFSYFLPVGLEVVKIEYKRVSVWVKMK